MADFRVSVTLDFTVPDGTDEDEFHDELRPILESIDFDASPYALDTVRDIEVSDITED